MSGTLFWDVDTQVDFIEQDAKLPVPGAEGIRDNLARLSQLAEEEPIVRVKTGDWHTLEDDEIVEDPEEADFAKTFPPHCMEASKGAEFIPETEPSPDHPSAVVEPRMSDPTEVPDPATYLTFVLWKTKFDVFQGNDLVGTVLNMLDPDRVYVYGVSGNVCVMHAVEGLLTRGYDVSVVTDAVESLPAEGGLPSFGELLEGWDVEEVTTDEVVNRFN